MRYELEARYDSRQSFYGKAHVIENGNKTQLQSYSTIVAEIERKENKTIYKCFGKYSQTTTRHQKEFFRQNGLSWNEIDELFKNGKLEIEEV